MTPTKSWVTARGNLRRAQVVVGLVALTLVALIVILPMDFYLTYGVEDPTVRDHLRFLVRAAEADVVLSALCAGRIARIMQLSWERSMTGALLVVLSAMLLVGTAYAGVSVLPALDYAVGSGASNRRCAGLSLALGVSTVISLAVGRRLLSPHGVHRPNTSGRL